MLWKHADRAAFIVLAAMLGGGALCGRHAKALGPGPNGTRYTLTSATASYRVKLTATELAHGPAESGSPPWGAGKLQTTWRVITSLEIWHGKERIAVPRSAFADLANASSISIKSDAHGCAIAIAGGDAGYAWNAVVRVDGKRVTRRTVRSAEFPDNAWEETRYIEHFPAGM